MRLEDLIGVSVVVVKSADVTEVAKGLDIILDELTRFDYFKPISGFPYSIRIFSAWSLPEGAPLPGRMTATILAEQLFRLTREEARYEQPEGLTEKKGWEIRKAFVQGKPVAVASAVWV